MNFHRRGHQIRVLGREARLTMGGIDIKIAMNDREVVLLLLTGGWRSRKPKKCEE